MSTRTADPRLTRLQQQAQSAAGRIKHDPDKAREELAKVVKQLEERGSK